MVEPRSHSCAQAAREAGKVLFSSPLVECGLWFMNLSFPKLRTGVELQSIQKVINVPHRDTCSDS